MYVCKPYIQIIDLPLDSLLGLHHRVPSWTAFDHAGASAEIMNAQHDSPMCEEKGHPFWACKNH